MSGAPAGAVVCIYLDTVRTLTVGDYIQTTSGRCYEIQAVRVQERGKHVGRQHLHVLVLPADFDLGAAIAEGATAHPLAWYPRDRKRP